MNEQELAALTRRFWGMVNKHGPLPKAATGITSRCWVWMGGVNDQGYGRMKWNGTRYMARRLAWALRHKVDPGEWVVSTRCHNQLCVRHLYTRTRRADKHEPIARPSMQGTRHPMSKLTERDVLSIRELATIMSQPKIAAMFKVSVPTIGKIVRGIGWRHI